MRLTAGVTIEQTDTVTRQTLWDLWARATGGQVSTGDFASHVFPIVNGSTPTSGPSPGLIWYDQTDLVWKCFYDQVDNTGVSLWMAFGPDRFDDAFLASQPIPGGALCAFNPAGTGRMVILQDGRRTSTTVCVNVTNTTIASGAWFTGAVEGFVKGWFPFKYSGATDSTNIIAGTNPNRAVLPAPWVPGGIAQGSGGNIAQQFIVGLGLFKMDPVTTVSNGNFYERFLFFGSRFTK